MKPWLIFQVVSFQAVWLLCVLGGNPYLPLVAAVLLVHFVCTPTRGADVKIAACATAGVIVDMLLWALGIFDFAGWPFWLVPLWMAFALNIGHSLRFLKTIHPAWVALLGALGGAYSYLVAWKLEAVGLPHGAIISGLAVAVCWGCILPGLVKLDGFFRQPH